MLASNGAETSEAEIRAAVHRAWHAVMPGTALDEGLTWQEAGIDSLKSLHLLLSVEQALARPVSFELLTRETRIGDLIALLAGRGERTRSAPRRGYLVPGWPGGDLQLAELSVTLRDEIAFETLRAPDLEDPIRVSADMEATAVFFADQVLDRAGVGPIVLAGFSFGAYAALATALALQARGVTVALLCLFDPLPGRWRAPKNAASPLRRRIKGLADAPLSTSMVTGLLWLGWFSAARRLALMTDSPRDVIGSMDRRRRVLQRLGTTAMRAWRPTAFHGRTILFSSGDFERLGGAGAFSRILPGVTAVPVGGEHLQMFKGEALRTIAAALRPVLEALPQSQASPLRSS